LSIFTGFSVVAYVTTFIAVGRVALSIYASPVTYSHLPVLELGHLHLVLGSTLLGQVLFLVALELRLDLLDLAHLDLALELNPYLQ
jgi:hypothetical protein